MFPITVVDNFLAEPIKFANYVKTFDFFSNEKGNYPGERTNPLDLEHNGLFRDIATKTLALFYESPPQAWGLDMRIQRVMPFAKTKEEQFECKNKGWIHVDTDHPLIGILYLDEDPLPNTGTSFYREKEGFAYATKESIDLKEALYLNKEVDMKKHEEAFHFINDQYEETMSVENVFNRLILFRGNQIHGAQTFGYGGKPRHIMNMFWMSPYGKISPLQRAKVI